MLIIFFYNNWWKWLSSAFHRMLQRFNQMFHKHACKIFLFSNWYTCKLLYAFIYLFFICSVVEKKKTVHNSTEKKRKEQIRHWIQQIGEQLPPLVSQKTEKERHGRVKIDWLIEFLLFHVTCSTFPLHGDTRLSLHSCKM